MLRSNWEGDGLARMIEGAEGLTDRQLKNALRRAVNHTGDKAYTVVRRVLAKQVGVSAPQLKDYGAVINRRANYSTLEYEIVSTGKHLPLKIFGARPTSKGVSAAPWGKRQIFNGTFVVKSRGGHVFKRTSSKRLPIKKLWGPAIPKELLRDPTAAAWRVVANSLPDRVAHEIKVISRGIVS